MADASAAAGARGLSVDLRVPDKLVLHPVFEPLRFPGPGVVAARLQRKVGEHARIPAPYALARRGPLLVGNIETVAGGAEVGAGPAGETFFRCLLPELVGSRQVRADIRANADAICYTVLLFLCFVPLGRAVLHA